MIFQVEDYLNIVQITKGKHSSFLFAAEDVPLLLQVDEEYKYCIDGVMTEIYFI